ncbi:MAG: thiamine-phosphate kinase [Candidatus Thermoplasmatota archaeon]|nr:thiamine-phosphate kinase [Candidatus Thermoplasmatota archaeon]
MLKEVVIVVKRLEDIGERNAIQKIEKILTPGKNSRGMGDDCAMIECRNEYLLVTTDMMSQQTHIPAQMTPYQMGWFLVAINLSDIAAKGGSPLGVVCSYGLPRRTSVSFLKTLTKGADACAIRYGTHIVGGDTKETTEITLCGTAIGTVKKDECMTRAGARPGDIVAVTGVLGSAGAGYHALKQQKQAQTLSKGLFEPLPRLKEGRMLAQQHTVTSSMDLSDGLSASLYQLQEVNAVGFEIQESTLPLAPGLYQLFGKHQKKKVYNVALHFGGDYELLVTIRPEQFQRTQHTLQKQGSSLTAIGRVTKKKELTILGERTKKVLKNKGYEHFKRHSF